MALAGADRQHESQFQFVGRDFAESRDVLRKPDQIAAIAVIKPPRLDGVVDIYFPTVISP